MNDTVLESHPDASPPGAPSNDLDDAGGSLVGSLRRRVAPTTRTDRHGRTPSVSFVVPVFNEVDAIPGFLETVGAEAERARLHTEFVFVNDGSTDQTLGVLLAAQHVDPRVRIVNLSRNFGKEAALTAGLRACRGDVVVPIDVDLQDPPSLLHPFIQKWREGYDVVYGVRRSRRAESSVVRLSSHAFYRVFNAITSTEIPRDVGDFRLMDRRVVESVLLLDERSRFMKGLFSWVGFPSVGVPYDRPDRHRGSSKWNSWRRWNFALDGIVGFSTVPLRIWTYAGLLIAALSAIYGSVILALALTGNIGDVPGYASLILVVLFLGSMQLVSLGLIGEYLGRVLIESKGRPLYLVEGIYECDEIGDRFGGGDESEQRIPQRVGGL